MFVFWFWLVFSLDALARFKQVLHFFQRNLLLSLLFFILFGILVWSTTRILYWMQLPLLQGAVLVILTTLACLILFTKPEPHVDFQTWRRR